MSESADPSPARSPSRRPVSRKASAAAQGTLPRIMLIRHAEKPAAHERGVDRHGHPTEEGLSVTGWQRAGALLRLFAPRDEADVPPRLAVPRHLFAAAPTPLQASTRPRDTLQPLADALGLPIDERFSTEDPLRAVAALLRSLHEPVLVCWRHDSLAALANELLQREEAPAAWPEHRFDLVWVVDTTGAGSFHQVPQKLLPHDSAQAVAKRIKAALPAT
jgi:broad specificity phosphatase PhoE